MAHLLRKARSATQALPDEIIVDEILKRLPVDFVVRFRSVSKLWNFLLSQSNYIQPLLNHSISQNFNDDYVIFSTRKSNGKTRLPDGISILSNSNSSEICLDKVPYNLVCNGDLVHLVGSINGLVCLVVDSGIDSVYHFILWNPAMNLSKKILLPCDFPTKIKGRKLFMFGFGLDSVTNNYKIIVQSTDSVLQAVEAVVYSSETDSWINIVGSKIPQPKFKVEIHISCWRPSVIVKGICYWDHCAPAVSNQVLKFEPKNNEFTHFTVPCFRKSYKLVNLNDCLARVEYASADDIMDVYFLGEECCTWSKIYTTNMGIYDFKLIQSCFRNGRMVVLFHRKRREYCFYDPKSNETKGLACSYDKKLYMSAFDDGFSYTPSLVALQGMKSLHS